MGGVDFSYRAVYIKEIFHIPFQRQGIEKGTNEDFKIKPLLNASGHLLWGPRGLNTR